MYFERQAHHFPAASDDGAADTDNGANNGANNGADNDADNGAE